MKPLYLRLLFIFSILFPFAATAQHTNFPVGVDVLEGNVYYADSKDPANKVWITVSWGDSSRVIPCDAQGRLNEGDLFYHTVPDSIKIECATTAYYVTKYKVKTYESAYVLDENGHRTADKWYLVMITVYVAKTKE